MLLNLVEDVYNCIHWNKTKTLQKCAITDTLILFVRAEQEKFKVRRRITDVFYFYGVEFQRVSVCRNEYN